MKYLITGAAGFIGAHFVNMLLAQNRDVEIIGVDSLTYAGDLSRIAGAIQHPKFIFIEADICNSTKMQELLKGVHTVFHFAAQSHVDRSLLDCAEFFNSNCYGTQVLLDSSLKMNVQKFVHVSTDEVYGSRPDGAFTESDRMNPTNPYSVSKASAEQLVLNTHRHDGLPILITRGANTYGTYQYPEKLIPFFVAQALNNQPLPLYGDGKQQRDWLHVSDHCQAIAFVAEKGIAGEIYNIPGSEHKTNIELTQTILKYLEKNESLIQYVQDRKGHDRRYAMSGEKLRQLGFIHTKTLALELGKTLQWYIDNFVWLETIRSKNQGDQSYFSKQYSNRIPSK